MIPQSEVTLPVLDAKFVVELKNEYAVVFFENIQNKIQFYKQFEQHRYIGQSVEGQTVAVIECGQQWLDRIDGLTGMSIAWCKDSSMLKTMVEQLPTRSDIQEQHLNTVIIENISAFYWEKKVSIHERVLWYKGIAGALTELMEKYKCNVIITAWDNEFERGFSFKQNTRVESRLDSVTFTPVELFAPASYLFAQKHNLWYQYLNSQWEQMHTD